MGDPVPEREYFAICCLTSDLGGPPPILGDGPSGLAVDEGGIELLCPLLVGGTGPEFLLLSILGKRGKTLVLVQRKKRPSPTHHI